MHACASVHACTYIHAGVYTCVHVRLRIGVLLCIRSMYICVCALYEGKRETSHVLDLIFLLILYICQCPSVEAPDVVIFLHRIQNSLLLQTSSVSEFYACRIPNKNTRRCKPMSWGL